MKHDPDPASPQPPPQDFQTEVGEMAAGQMDETVISGDVGSRRRQYLLVAALSLLAAAVGHWGLLESTLGVYLLIESLITMVAFIVGLFALIRHFSNRGMLYLYAGIGFLAVGCLELMRLLAFTTGYSINYHGISMGRMDYLIWSSTINHLYLGVIMFAAMWETRGLRHVVIPNSLRTTFTIGILAFACGVALLFGPVFPAVAEWIVPRPLELLPGGLWVASAILLYRHGVWRADTFLHWLLLSLIFASGAALLLYPLTYDLLASRSLVAQLVKLGAFLLVLVGLGNSMFELVRRVESSMLAEQRLNESLQREIRERRQAERALLASRADLAEAQQIAHLGNWAWEMGTNRYQFSDELAQIIDIPSVDGSWSIEQLRDAIHPEDVVRLDEKLIQLGKNPQDWEMYCRIFRRDGEMRTLMLRGRIVIGENGQVTRLRGTAQDLTEIVQTQQQLRETAERLAASNRDLEEFAYIASHDLQEPLRKITAFADRVLTMYSDKLDATARDYLSRVCQSAERMQTLINDVLALSRINTRQGDFVEIALFTVFQDVLDDLETRIQEEGAQVEIAEPLPVVFGDPVQLRQLFLNLITNGIKFSPPDRLPVLTVRTFEARRMIRNTPFVTLEVADNGIGFDTRYAERIFQPFQRLHSRTKFDGTGMGLSICRRIVERHGGHIRADSTPGKGSRFYVSLPLKSPGPVTENDRAHTEAGLPVLHKTWLHETESNGKVDNQIQSDADRTETAL